MAKMNLGLLILLTHGDGMSVKRNIWYWKNAKLICVFICILLVLVFWLCSQYFFGPGMIAPFKEAKGLTRAISLLSTVDYGESVICTKLTQNSYLSAACVFQSSAVEHRPNRSPVVFAITPDYSRFYIGTKKTIHEYTGNGQHIRNINIPEFDMNPYQYSHLEKIQASNTQLWILLSYDTDDQVKDVIAECSLDDQIPVPHILTTDAFNEVNIFGQVALDLKNEGGMYKLDSKEVVGKLWSQVNISEVIATDSLISNDVSYIDMAGNSKSNITNGSQAMWASDGYIYFLRKGTQLWRVRPGSKPEAVYKATGFARGRNSFIGNELIFNNDRTCLAFCYRVPIYELTRNEYNLHNQVFGTVRCGVVVIDLVTNEYIHIPEKNFYDIYRKLYSGGSLDLSEPIRMSLNFNKHFWHLSNMALVLNSGKK